MNMYANTFCPVCGNNQFKQITETQDYTVTNERFQIIQCTKCTCALTYPQPDQDRLPSYYQSDQYISHASKAASVFDRIYIAVRRVTLTWKTKIIATYAKEKSILDYGCGTGNFVHHLKSKGWKVLGIEPSTKAFEQAQQQISKPEIAQELRPNAGQFSIITLWHVLEHVPDPKQTLNTLKKHLQERGTLFIAVPNLNSWESNHYGQYWAAYDTPRHLWHFTRTSMQHLAQSVNLEIKNIIPMKQDAFYVSMLSEKYQHNRPIGPILFAKGLLSGLRSNRQARTTKEYSSLIYVLQNEKS